PHSPRVRICLTKESQGLARARARPMRSGLSRWAGPPELPERERLPANVFLAAIRRSTVEMVPRVLAIGLFSAGLGASAALGVALLLTVSGNPGGPGPEGALACSAL